MDERKNPTGNESLGRTVKPQHSLVANYLTQMALALNQEIQPERIALYCQALSDIGENQTKHAFNQALRHLGEFLPSIRELSDWAESWRPDEQSETRQFKSVSDIDPEKCPKGWSPEDVFRAHLTQEKIRGGARRRMTDEDGEFPTLETLGRNSGATKAEIARWLEEGKRKQQAEYAELARDPKWRMEQARAGVPAYRHLAEQSKRPSTIPEDPEERRVWARKKAVENGWVTREPGDEL